MTDLAFSQDEFNFLSRCYAVSSPTDDMTKESFGISCDITTHQNYQEYFTDTTLRNMNSIKNHSFITELFSYNCCDIGQNDTIGKIELFSFPSCHQVILILTFSCLIAWRTSESMEFSLNSC